MSEQNVILRAIAAKVAELKLENKIMSEVHRASTEILAHEFEHAWEKIDGACSFVWDGYVIGDRRFLYYGRLRKDVVKEKSAERSSPAKHANSMSPHSRATRSILMNETDRICRRIQDKEMVRAEKALAEYTYGT